MQGWEDNASPRRSGDDIAIRIRSPGVQPICYPGDVVTRSGAETPDQRDETQHVVVSGYPEVILVPASCLRDAPDVRGDVQLQENLLHPVPKLRTAGGVIHTRCMIERLAHVDAAVRRPEMAEEDGDAAQRLGEDLRWDPLLVRTEAEHPKPVQPGGDRVAPTMGEPLRGGEVNLVPAPLSRDARGDLPAEHPGGESRHQLSQLAVRCRVLDDVTGEGAPIADEVAEEGQLVLRHGPM